MLPNPAEFAPPWEIGQVGSFFRPGLQKHLLMAQIATTCAIWPGRSSQSTDPVVHTVATQGCGFCVCVTDPGSWYNTTRRMLPCWILGWGLALLPCQVHTPGGVSARLHPPSPSVAHKGAGSGNFKWGLPEQAGLLLFWSAG